MIKNIFTATILVASSFAHSQTKDRYTQYQQSIEIKGTPYVVVSAEDKGKYFEVFNRYLLFVDTEKQQKSTVEFPVSGAIEQIEQVKVDELQINLVLALVQNRDVIGNVGVDFNTPKQLYILSVDGSKVHSLTDKNFFVKSWSVNHQTGTLLVTGYSDDNLNKKYDREDKNELLIYSLTDLKLLSRL